MYEYETLSSYTTGYYEIKKLTEECCLFVIHAKKFNRQDLSNGDR